MNLLGLTMGKDSIKISGVCIREGISRNKRRYIATELDKFSKTMVGKPILSDHEATISSAIGTITKSESMDNGKFITYEADIYDDGKGTIEKIKRGILKEVSIGALAGKILRDKEDKELIIPINMEALELSIVVCPGNRGTSLNVDTEENYTEEQLKEMINNYDKENIKDLENEQESSPEDELNLDENQTSQTSQSNINIDKHIIQKEENMETQETKSTANVEENNDKLEAMKKELDSSKESLETLNKVKETLEKEKSDLEEARRQDAINRYKEKAEAKNLTPKDLSKATMEMVNFAIEMADEAEEPKVEEPKVEEPKVEEPKVEEPKEEEKPEAEPQSKEVDSEEEPEEKFKGYVVTQEGCSSGWAFFKDY